MNCYPLTLPSSADLAHLREEGYAILRQAFTPQRIESLREGIRRMGERDLAGHIKINWINREMRIIARNEHMLAPDKYDDAFAQWQDEDVIPLLEVLLGGPGRHSLFGMLAAGDGKPYLQGWHRDLARPGAPDEEAVLARHDGKLLQFNAPLLADDEFLQIVPASHRRRSTAAELALNKKCSNDMPGALTVRVQPGDVVFYNANLWHRGHNPHGKPRCTMHVCYWQPQYRVMKHEWGQRDALLTPGHLDRMPPRSRLYIQRYLDAYPQQNPPTLHDL